MSHSWKKAWKPLHKHVSFSVLNFNWGVLAASSTNSGPVFNSISTFSGCSRILMLPQGTSKPKHWFKIHLAKMSNHDLRIVFLNQLKDHELEGMYHVVCCQTTLDKTQFLGSDSEQISVYDKFLNLGSHEVHVPNTPCLPYMFTLGWCQRGLSGAAVLCQSHGVSGCGGLFRWRNRTSYVTDSCPYGGGPPAPVESSPHFERSVLCQNRLPTDPGTW